MTNPALDDAFAEAVRILLLDRMPYDLALTTVAAFVRLGYDPVHEAEHTVSLRKAAREASG